MGPFEHRRQVSKRLPISRHCPSGLAPVEALLPLGEGQRVGLASWATKLNMQPWKDIQEPGMGTSQSI